jgi:hypothetical protein
VSISVVCGEGFVTVHERTAGVGSTLPAGSVAFTWNECGAYDRLLYAFGEVQALKAALSSEQANVEPASVAVNAKLAEVEVTFPDGPDVIVVFGGVWSGGGVVLESDAASTSKLSPATGAAS